MADHLLIDRVFYRPMFRDSSTPPVTLDCEWVWMDDDPHVWMDDDQAQFLNCDVTAQVSGLAYTLSNAFTGSHTVGTHYHVTNVPANEDAVTIPIDNYAEVGGFFGDESVRGIIDFDLTGMPNATTAVMSFVVTDLIALGIDIKPVGGLYGQDPWVGDIQVLWFTSDGVEAVAKYSLGTSIGTFSAAGLTAGQTVMIDITSVYNARVTAGDSFLGIQLRTNPENPDDEAITFEQFKLMVS